MTVRGVAAIGSSAPAAGESPGCWSSAAHSWLIGGRVLLPDGLDGPVELQVQPGHLPSPFALPTTRSTSSRWAEAWEVGNLGRYALNSAIVTGVSVTLILLIGCQRGVRVQPLPVPGPDAGMGLFALGLLLPLQAYFIAQSNAVHAARHHRHVRWR